MSDLGVYKRANKPSAEQAQSLKKACRELIQTVDGLPYEAALVQIENLVALSSGQIEFDGKRHQFRTYQEGEGCLAEASLRVKKRYPAARAVVRLLAS